MDDGVVQSFSKGEFDSVFFARNAMRPFDKPHHAFHSSGEIALISLAIDSLISSREPVRRLAKPPQNSVRLFATRD
jgi:hypothetical protein